jgi:hypothetical protein
VLGLLTHRLEGPVADVKKKPGKREFEVLVSFNGLDKGERFVQDGADVDWAMGHVQTGYLRDVTEEVPDAGRGEVDQG